MRICLHAQKLHFDGITSHGNSKCNWSIETPSTGSFRPLVVSLVGLLVSTRCVVSTLSRPAKIDLRQKKFLLGVCIFSPIY